MADPQLVPVDHDPWANADREPFTADQIALPPPSAAGTVGPNAANAVGRAVGGAAIAPLWDAGQYVGGLLHGNEQWDSSKAVQLAGGLGAMFFPFGRGGAAAKGAADVMESAVPRATEAAVPKGIDVYHGSPHDFDRFDLSKIGTGEGAQAYGHGLYFADNPDVAKAYAEALPRVGNEPFDGSNPLHAASMAIHESGSREGAIQQITDTMNKPGFYGDQELHDFDNATLKILRDPAIEPPPMQIGRQYAARINADPEHFLDWDRPLSEQSDFVRGALENHPDPMIAGTFAKHGYEVGSAYNRVAQRLGGERELGSEGMKYPVQYSDEAKASEALRRAGIPGIRYADQGSRGSPVSDAIDAIMQRDNPKLFAAEKNAPSKSRQWMDAYDNAAEQAHAEMAARGPQKQTSNYVVFDDKLIDIIKKYGLAGLVAGGGYSIGGGHGHVIPADHNPFAQ